MSDSALTGIAKTRYSRTIGDSYGKSSRRLAALLEAWAWSRVTGAATRTVTAAILSHIAGGPSVGGTGTTPAFPPGTDPRVLDVSLAVGRLRPPLRQAIEQWCGMLLYWRILEARATVGRRSADDTSKKQGRWFESEAKLAQEALWSYERTNNDVVRAMCALQEDLDDGVPR